MVAPNSGVTEFKSIKIKVLNLLLFYMALGALPLLATSLLIFFSSGWKVSMIIDTVGLLSLPLVYLLRNRISYRFKSAYLIFMGYVAGIIILHDYSFFGTGIIILSSVTLTSTLFFGMRTGWFLMAVNLVSIAVLGILYHYNYISYTFDFERYIRSHFTWFDHVVTFLFFIGIVVIASGKMHKALVEIIDQSKVEKEKFKGLFNNIQDAIMIYTYDGVILEINNSFLEMYGINREIVFNSKAGNFSILEDLELGKGNNELGIFAKKQYETKAVRFDDQREFDIEVMLSPIEYGDQKAILANIRNISQRKISEESLRKSEEKYRSLIESSPAGIFIIEDDIFLYINPSGAKNLGFNSTNELIGKNVYTVIAPEFRTLVENRLSLARNKVVNNPAEIKLVRTDGQEMWVETVSLPFEYYSSNAILIMGFDITERKKGEELILQKNMEIERRNLEYSLLNQKLKIAKEKAEESDRLKSAFLSNMSHEIRTPMNAILGFSDLLIRTKLPENKRTEYIEIIHSSGNQLLSLINDIIDISKIESNQIVIDETSVVNISDIFKQLSVIFYSKAQNRKIELKYSVSLTELQRKVYLDEIRLKQILGNLIGNAIKFTHSGAVSYTVRLQSNELLFLVEDTGIGIDPRMQNVIFDRFRQADGSTTRDYGGTGLGLAISKALVELMGGRIWLSSEVEKGTVFYFTMPFKPFDTEEREIDNTSEESVENCAWKTKHILIVEDEEVNILFLTELLRPTGVRVSVARNATEAYEEIHKHNTISLVLMDIKIPKVDGYEITSVIKRENPRLIVIAQTAYALAEEKNKILNSGFDDYISKPINKNLLYNLISRYI